MNGFRFTNRADAGRRLAILLERYARRHDTVVLALARGGVPVADEIASELHLPLDVFVVRKLGLPGHEELAMGAIAADGRVILDGALIAAANISQAQLAAVVARESIELQRRIRLYRDGRAERSLKGQTVILVDDGVATGSTMGVAIHAVRAHDPSSVIVAVPVGSREACDDIEALADTLVCLLQPEPFEAVGSYYRDFSQTTDDEVRRYLAEAALTEAGRWLAV
ncbi:MAG: phosphoribosyltransferase [Candidatus Baltobacteraceae bacterium]